MKRELLNPKTILAAAAAATLLTGCASVDRGYSDVAGPSSALAFTVPTDPNQMIKWTGDRFLLLSQKSIDTYYFQVPDTGYNPGAISSASGGPAVYMSGTGSSMNRDDVVVEPSHSYQTESRSYKTIQYRPGQ